MAGDAGRGAKCRVGRGGVAESSQTGQNPFQNRAALPKPSETEQKIYFLLKVRGEPSYATPQIPCKLAPPKTKSNGLTAAPRRKPFLVRVGAGQLEKARFRTGLWFPTSPP